jgi:hypothetical protein
MSNQQYIKFKIYLAYIVIGGLPFYYFLREYLPISVNLYAGMLGLLFLVSLYQIFKIQLKKKSIRDKFFLLEIVIILNTIFIFLYLGNWERSLVLLCMTLYISKGLFALESNDNFRTAANIITCSAFIAAIGVFFGIFESLAGNTTFFIQKMDFDYPYSNGLDETTLVNGFFASANSSAYALGAGLAFIKFQNLCRNNFKLYLYMFLFIALMITKTKFVFLIAATYLGFIFLKNTSRKLLVFYLLLLGMSYLFLSHIMIAASGTYDYPSLHYRKRLFSIGSIDFILGAYGMLKVYAFEAITANILLPNGLENFVTTYGGRPHFMFGTLIISGGISTAILVFTYIYSLIKNKWDEALKGLDDNQVYLTILFCFIIETFNWNFTNNFYFWSVVMGLGFINKYKNI